MLRIWFRRLIRYIRGNLGRFVGLLLFTTVVTCIVVTLVAAAYTVLDGHALNAENECIEDGEFELFLPLSNDELDDLRLQTGMTIEEAFNFDAFSGDIKIRFFSNRKIIDKVVLEGGHMPERDSEIVVEQLFYETNNLKLGDTLKVGNTTLAIVGYGSVMDYTCPLENMTDATANTKYFTWAVVNQNTYDQIKAETKSEETYLYTFLQNSGSVSDLRLRLKMVTFNAYEYACDHEYFMQYARELMAGYKAKYGIDASLSLADNLRYYAEVAIADAELIANARANLRAEINDYLQKLWNKQGLTAEESKALRNAAINANKETVRAYDEIKTIYTYILQFGFKGKMSAEVQSVLTSYNLRSTLYGSQALLASAFADSLDYVTYSNPLTAKSTYDLYRSNLDTLERLGKVFDNYEENANVLRQYVGSEEFSEVMTEELEYNSFIKTFVTSLVSLTERKDNPRMNNDINYAYLYRDAGYLTGIGLFVLLALIFASIMRHQIQNEESVIGTQIAIGVSKASLVAFYTIPSALVSLIGGALGLILGYSPLLMNLSVGAFHTADSFPYYDYAYTPILFVYALAVPLLVSVAVNVITLCKYFGKKPIDMIRKIDAAKPRISASKMSGKFTVVFRAKQIRREIGAIFIIFLGVLISTILLILGINTKVLVDNNANKAEVETPYEYLTILRYPLDSIETTGERIYMCSLVDETYVGDINVYLVGIASKSEFYDFEIPNQPGVCVVSRAYATKADAKIGDTITLANDVTGNEYIYTIESVVDTGSRVEVYTNINQLRDAMGTPQSYYNAIISDEPQDIPAGLVLSEISKAEITSIIQKEANSTRAFVTFSITAAVIMYAVVIYLMCGMIISHAERGISLMRILGYTDGEVAGLYITGNVLITAIVTLLAIPLAKWVCEYICRYVYRRLPIGLFLEFSPWTYILVGGIALFILCAIILTLIFRIKGVKYSQILRTRA